MFHSVKKYFLFLILIAAMVIAAIYLLADQPTLLVAFNVVLGIIAFLFYSFYAKSPPQTQKETPAAQLDVEAFINAQALPVMLVRQDGAIVNLNQNMCDVFDKFGNNRDRTQFIGQHFSTMVRNPQVADAFEQVTQTQQNTEFHFEPHNNADGYFWAHIASITPDKLPSLCIMTFRNLTQDRKLEQMRADFVSNASHELRTPLASISGFIETLQNSAKDDEKARATFLPIMQEQAHRMTRLIDDLLSLSKIEMNIHSKPQDKINLAEISQNILDTAAPKAQDKNVELVFDCQIEDTNIKGDADQLQQLLGNLIDNALKYGLKDHQDNKIILRLSHQISPQKITLSIIDFGHGIPQNDLPRITERFYRASNQHTQKGTGLGLAIVKHIVQRHSGDIQFKSQIDQGTEVEISFPKY